MLLPELREVAMSKSPSPTSPLAPLYPHSQLQHQGKLRGKKSREGNVLLRYSCVVNKQKCGFEEQGPSLPKL